MENILENNRDVGVMQILYIGNYLVFGVSLAILS